MHIVILVRRLSVHFKFETVFCLDDARVQKRYLLVLFDL